MKEDFGILNTSRVDLNTADPRAIVCYINSAHSEDRVTLKARLSALFVVWIVATMTTLLPVLATKAKRVHVPHHVYLFARYFGAGVIVATAFIHLLEPAYEKIGPQSCVGMTGGWAEYSWPPSIAISSAMATFLSHFVADRCVEKRHRSSHNVESPTPDEELQTPQAVDDSSLSSTLNPGPSQYAESKDIESLESRGAHSIEELKEKTTRIAFQQQIAAFLVLEFGIIFHSAIIGLTLGTAGPEFAVLFPVIAFHQAFEGLGIGARLSAIPIPNRLRWLPWVLCTAYGLSTPIAIAVAIGIGTTYDAGSFTANVVSGLLDSVSAGILIYTGFVELIARDFLFDPERPDNDKTLAFMVISLLLGVAIMALLGKWA